MKIIRFLASLIATMIATVLAMWLIEPRGHFLGVCAGVTIFFFLGGLAYRGMEK